MPTSTDIESLLSEFESHLKIRNLKPKTIADALWHLRRFFDYLETQGICRIARITKEIITAYRIEQYERVNQNGNPNSIRYQNLILRPVKQFTAFLKEKEYILSDPGKDIEYAREPLTLPRSILNPSETRNLLNTPDVNSILGYRDRTMLEVLYSTGIRKSELENLTVMDVDYHDGFLRINKGKGGKDRVVPLGKIACRFLENYIKSVRPELVKDPHNDHLFLSVRGNRINQNMVWRIIKKYAKQADIKKNIHCHTMRHTCATSMLKNKANIRAIQELLGHKSLVSTQVYTHVSISDLKEIHARCHPRELDDE